MAHALSITDGATTINLNLAGGNMIEAYDMASKPDSGSDKLNPEFTETIDIWVVASSGPNLQAAINAIQLMMVAAQRRTESQVGARIFLQLQVDGDANTFRAEIKEGDLKPDKDAMRLWPNNKAQHSLIFVRYAWEGPRKELSISTSTQAAATGGRTITNDGANYIQIASGQVGGVLPAPLELQLTNTSGSNLGYRNFYINTNAYSDPANFSFRLGSTSSTLSGSGSSYTGQLDYSLTSAMLQDTQGRSVKFLVRMASQGGNVYCKPVVADAATGISLIDGDERYMPFSAFGTQFFDMGSLPLPPGGWQTGWAAATLSFKFRGAGAYSIGINAVQLTALDSFRYITMRGSTIVNGGTVTIDEIERVVHAGGISIFSPRAGIVRVFPGVTQRVHILQDTGGSSTTTHSFSVRAYVRERRLTV